MLVMTTTVSLALPCMIHIHSTMMIHSGMAENVTTYSCCTSPNIPWFFKSLNQSTTDDIELRLCTSEGYRDEATPVDIIELYVH